MGRVWHLGVSQAITEPEDQALFLPSDFPNDGTRERLDIDRLGEMEMKLREGEAHDALRELRTIVKYINGLTYKKLISIRNAGPNTRAKEMIDDAKKRRTASIEKYRASRTALIELGSTKTGDEGEFPALAEADATMKYTERPHALGDGSKTMAMIWRAGGKKRVRLTKNESMIGMLVYWYTTATDCLHRF